MQTLHIPTDRPTEDAALVVDIAARMLDFQGHTDYDVSHKKAARSVALNIHCPTMTSLDWACIFVTIRGIGFAPSMASS